MDLSRVAITFRVIGVQAPSARSFGFEEGNVES